MNFSKSQVTNYLFTSSENDDNIGEFIKVAITLIEEMKIVLLFTRKHFDFLSNLAGLSKEQMQNFIISYQSDLSGIIDKLLELQDWTILPDLVIVNLNSYFDDAVEPPPFKQICFCIASLLSYMRSVGIQKGVCTAKSVSLLNTHRDVQIQMLIDFYFYKMAAFSELEEIKNKILN